MTDHDQEPTPLSRRSRLATRLHLPQSRGQVVVIFAGAMLLFAMLSAAVIDLSWYWTSNLRMQRAADAAALAGVVWLPGNPVQAIAVARAEAVKNGYTNGVGGYTVTPVPDPSNDRRLMVNITGPVGTYFARIVGISSFQASRDAKADFVLPVPMGSPENYYGVGYLIEPVTTTTTTNGIVTTNFETTSAAPSGGQWSYNSGFGNNIWNVVDNDDSDYAYEATNGEAQQWNQFDLLSGLNANQSPGAVVGIEVRLSDTRISGTCANTRVSVALSWNNGAPGSWTTTTTETPNLTTTQSQYVLGSITNTSAWGGHTWTGADLSNGNFRVRATAVKGCGGSSEIRIDELEVRARLQVTTTTTTTTLQQTNVTSPSGGALTPQNFWGAMQSQGAPNIQGDAFMTKYATRTSVSNVAGGSDPDAVYDPNKYYNYGVEIPANGGAVWIFDPGFCDGTSTAGTGENWTVGGSNGNSTRQPVSAYFDLLSTNNTPFDLSDDGVVASTGNTFRRLNYEDHDIFDAMGQGTNVPDCSSQSWHFGWYQLASGLPAGDYRLHTYSTDFSSPNDQNNTTALNAFAFYVSSPGGSPRVYGLGTMEAYMRLPGGTASEFYLAQIEAIHAGKTMVINLWDPGDTGALAANLQILRPTGGAYAAANFSYQGVSGTGGSSSGCGSRSGTNVTSVTTNTGGTSLFNGCWLTIEVDLPANYTAPNDPVSGEPGWWKIRYNMSGSASSFSTDLTTWQVNIRGNPVHLVLP